MSFARVTMGQRALSSVSYVSAPSGEAMAPADSHMAEHGVIDVDLKDQHDPHCATDYVNQIYAWFKEMEVTKSARHGYMVHQTDINEKMRAILIDWLVEVHLKFKLMPETMYLTVNIIDRFLERKIVMRNKLQLVGVTAMLLASKYEEIYAPEVRDFVYITDKAYSREQILGMETSMLKELDFRITVPTSYVFVNRYAKVAEADIKTLNFAAYITERVLQEYKMLMHLPSKIAAAAVNIAVRTQRGRHAWTPTLTYYTGYTQEDLVSIIHDVQDVLTNASTSTLQAVKKKHENAKFQEVSKIVFTPLD